MRECKAAVWSEGKKVPVKGLFHQWAQQYEDCGDAGIANYTVGLVELDDGRIVEVIPDTVVFTEPAKQDSIWWRRSPMYQYLMRDCNNCDRTCKQTYPLSNLACGNWISRADTPHKQETDADGQK